jgi:hypothetical protein
LKIVDCHSSDKIFNIVEHIFNPPKLKADVNFAVWSMINEVFSLPIRNSDTSTEYIPTQILAELFKAEEFGGICFKSSIGEGLNYTLFNVNSAEFVKSRIMKCSAIAYKFEAEMPSQ